MYIQYIIIIPKRLRPNLMHVYLHPEEDRFLKAYAESNYLTVSEFIRGWMHKVMKREGYIIKEPFVPESKKTKKGYNNMGSVYLRGDSWVVKYKDENGNWKRKTLGQKPAITKTSARVILNDIERKVKLRQYKMIDTVIPKLGNSKLKLLGVQIGVHLVTADLHLP